MTDDGPSAKRRRLPGLDFYLFTTRIPRNVDIDFTESYKP
eukprot:COSAG01_NODE_28375_length_662_cov_1.497336_1_plen_39_part_10